MRSLFEVVMLDKPRFDFGNSKNCVLSWGHFDLGTLQRSKSSPPLYWQYKNVFEGQNMSDRNARNGEDACSGL